MKKSILFFPAVGLALMLLAGCSSDRPMSSTSTTTTEETSVQPASTTTTTVEHQ